MTEHSSPPGQTARSGWRNYREIGDPIQVCMGMAGAFSVDLTALVVDESEGGFSAVAVVAGPIGEAGDWFRTRHDGQIGWPVELRWVRRLSGTVVHFGVRFGESDDSGT